MSYFHFVRHVVCCFVAIATLAGCTSSSSVVFAANLYSQKIIAPEKPGNRLQPAIADLQSALKEMTGQEFSTGTEYTGPGIYLLQTSSPHAPAAAVAKLKNKGLEPFIIRSQDEKNLWIIANGEEGLSHGIYYYLDQLGVRWLLPNDNWTVIPRRNDIGLKSDLLVAPAFKVRSYFGTGGFGGLAPYDPKLTFKDQVLNWQRRNRFGAEYHLDGHAGEAFNSENKEILLKHPEYLAKVDGKHVPWSAGAKLNTANPAAVKLFVDWSLEKFRQKRKWFPDSPQSVAVSVDPSDGGGHCNSEECRRIGNGSVSDQVFYIANQVAKAVRQEFPDGKVNLYAYNQHAAVPSFPLEENIIVSIIPYAFQNTGLTPEQFIKAWGEKLPTMNLYDYWSITDWTHDEPSFNYLSTPAQKLRFWNANNIEGFSGESTYGAGAMGIGWYVASRLMWDPKVDEKAVIEEWYDLAFGPAKAPMKRMMERWATSFMLTSAELGHSYRDLQEAMQLGKGNAAVQERIDDYGRYLHYLRLKLELANATDPAARAAKEREYVEHLFDIYDSRMIHSFRLYQFAVDYGRKKELFHEFNNTDKNAPGWQRVAPLTHSKIEVLIADGAKQYQPLDFMTRSFDGPLTRLDKSPLPNEAEWSPAMIFIGTTAFELDATPGVPRFPLRVKSAKGTTSVKVFDQSEKIVFATEVAPGEAWRTELEEVTITVPQPGRYRLLLENRGNSFNMQAPSNVPLVWRRFLTNMGAPSPRIYFYVPAGLKNIAVFEPHGASPRFFNAAGEPVTPQSHDNGVLLILPVPPGQDGAVWSVEFLRLPNKPLRMLNVPQVFSFFPKTLLVPHDTLNP